MKKLFLFFSLMVATMALVSCGNDDEPNLQFDKETIVGAWEITEVQGTPEWWVDRQGHCAHVQFQRHLLYRILYGRLL